MNLRNIKNKNFLSKLLVTFLLVLILLQYMLGYFRFNWTINMITRSSSDDYVNHFTQKGHSTPVSNNLIDSTSEISNNTNINDINILSYYDGNETIFYNNNTSEDVSEENVTYSLSPCPPVPPNLTGRVAIVKSPIPLIQELENHFTWLLPGGHYIPTTCQTQHRVAIIIPYRSRAKQLLLFLQHIHPLLKRQQIEYTIFIVEQNGSGNFNRAMLMNVGFKEALKIQEFDCFIFHDVDLLPEDDRNLYTCPEQPRHMSVAVDVFGYKLPYNTIFGGVSALTKEQFMKVNGFSNKFWGWGGEDDDMSNRIAFHNYHISRYPANIARYTMLTHRKQQANPKRYDVLYQGKKRYDTDGLSDLDYNIVQSRANLLYTWFLVDLKKLGR